MAASIEFGILNQSKAKVKMALEWSQYKDVPLTALVSKIVFKVFRIWLVELVAIIL